MVLFVFNLSFNCLLLRILDSSDDCTVFDKGREQIRDREKCESVVADDMLQLQLRSELANVCAIEDGMRQAMLANLDLLLKSSWRSES